MRLRTLQEGDAEAILKYANNYQVVKMLEKVAYPLTMESVQTYLSRTLPAIAQGTCFSFAITEDDSDELIGNIECRIEDDGAHIGYWLRQDSWGKGYMSHALKKALRLVFQQTDLSEIKTCSLVENIASGRVIQKAGFEETGRCCLQITSRNSKEPCILYAIRRSNLL
jgi:ribosomal-protein-alanine N-acetyltransferase